MDLYAEIVNAFCIHYLWVVFWEHNCYALQLFSTRATNYFILSNGVSVH